MGGGAALGRSDGLTAYDSLDRPDLNCVLSDVEIKEENERNQRQWQFYLPPKQQTGIFILYCEAHTG